MSCVSSNETIAVIGLGYVGLPLAMAFAEAGKRVIGFDTNAKKITAYTQGQDPTGEVGSKRLQAAETLFFTNNPDELSAADIFIVAVPTPVDQAQQPDTSILESACRLVGRVLRKGNIVVFESTVYPGCTEEVCLPILESESGLQLNTDFSLGYSPERVSPGDDARTLQQVVKVVAGSNDTAKDYLVNLYGQVIEAGIYPAKSIQVAEAAKVIENTQRDINIAFVNELSMIFDRLGLNTQDILDTAASKWNFLSFKPGLVGGHCIGVDPYYLSYKAMISGARPEMICAGRRINDAMAHYVVEQTIKKMIQSDISIKGARIGVMGVTFKENCPDIRNSKVFDVIKELADYGAQVIVTDPCADPDDVYQYQQITLEDQSALWALDVLIVAVNNRQFESMEDKHISSLYRIGHGVCIDVKGCVATKIERHLNYWSLLYHQMPQCVMSGEKHETLC